MKFDTTIKLLCDYCGEECSDTNEVVIDDLNYCCYGCATLSKVASGINFNPTEVSLKYKQLDFQDTFNSLVDYQDDSVYGITISLPNIQCSSCIRLIEDLPSLNDDVISSRVNFEKKVCKLIVRKSLALSFLAQLIDDIGYPPLISVSQKQKIESDLVKRNTLMKLAVAGFCFGNIMLMSMAHYFGLNFTNDEFFGKLFSFLSLALCLPVVFYSGKDYLVSAFKSLVAGRAHINIPISIGILSLFIWSVYEVISGNGIGYLDSLSGLIFFLLIGKWFQSKVYNYVSFERTLNEFIPFVVRKKAQKSFVWTSISDLDLGDQIIVKNEEIIPVNGSLSSGTGIIDYAFISGESRCEQVLLGKQIYAGGCQKSGEIVVTINEKPSMDKLWNTWSNQLSKKEFSNSFVDVISKYFTLSIISVAVLAFIYWYFQGSLSQALFVFSSVLIIACPCALALSSPFTFGNILKVFNTNKFFLKNPEIIATLSKINHIVFDKTGTLTQNKASQLEFIGDSLSTENRKKFRALASQSKHPLSILLAEYLSGGDDIMVHDFMEYSGKGIQGTINGSVVMLGSASWVYSTKNRNTVIYASVDGKAIGFFQLKPVYRKGLKQMLLNLGRKVKVSVLSGDNDGEKLVLNDLYGNFDQLHFNLLPKDKALKINQIQTSERVMMIGDGLNDASAIETCDVGVAITENLNGFYPSSDAVLLADGINKLPKFIDLARYSKRVLNWSLIFSLGYNLIGITFAVMGLLTPIVAAILMPLSSISIVLLDTFLVRLKSKKLKLI